MGGGEGTPEPEVAKPAKPGAEVPPPKTFADIFQKAQSKTAPAENVALSESKFTQVPENITPLEQRKLLGLALEIGVRAAMRNHIYTFGGEIWVQTEGGAIGLRLTGEVAGCEMDHWFDLMSERLKRNKVIIHLMEKYVDDINTVLEMFRLGTRWDASREELVWSQKDHDADVLAGLSQEQITMEAWVGMANGLVAGLKFTYDIGEKHPVARSRC